jgi:hypothetical protein
MDQWVPVRCSARVQESLIALLDDPTAVQVPATGHDNASMLLEAEPSGMADAWMAHAAPFQCSTSARALPEISVLLPTAVQSAAAVQLTPARLLDTEAVGWGVFSIVHEVPFHRSAKVAWFPLCRPSEYPTAVQAVAVAHDTPVR